MIKKLVTLFLLFFTVALNAQNFNLNQGWNLVGAGDNNITMNQFNNDNLSSIWKWNGSSWSVWSPDSTVMTLVDNYGLGVVYNVESGDGFWINAKNSVTINALPMCETRFLPVATVSSDYKTGGYAIYDYVDNKTYKGLNSYPVGGDNRVYFYNGYIFVVDAPNTGNISTWYVYKIDNNASNLDENAAKTPVANYNINRQNPHSVAFATINKAYIATYFDNSILIFNPLTGEELGTIDLTPYLYVSDNGTTNKYVGAEHMLIYKNKLFVTLDRARTYYGDLQPDKGMLLVINMENDTVEKSIEIDFASRAPQIYKNYLYFLAMGNYSAPIGKIFRIDLSSYGLDKDFTVSSLTKEDNSTDYIKNFIITPEGALVFVANAGWGKPYNVYGITNIELYDDDDKSGLISQPIYSSTGYISDMDFYCGNIVLTDRGSSPGLVFIPMGEGDTFKISDTDLGYPPYKIGSDYNY